MKLKKYTSFISESNNKDLWDIIPQSIKDIHDLFCKRNKKLFLVGGSVRDFLIGDIPKDFDLCTDAYPEEILDILGGKYETNLHGKSFGVIVAYTDDQPKGIEIATFRSDTYDGKTRNPTVEYTTIENDVLRRDIGINGLFYDLGSRKIIDLVNGISDIDNKMIKMIGDPEKRINEDPLRILRVCRFSYRYGFKIDDKTKNDIIKSKSSLSMIPRERIWEEIKKSYSYKKQFKEYLDIITELDLWVNIFTGSNINENVVECEHLACYIANLFINEDISKLENKLVMSYKIESEISSKSSFLIKIMDLNPNMIFEFFKLKIKCGISDNEIMDWVKSKNLDKDIFNSFIEYKPSISADSLMKMGFKGKDLGNEIKKRESDIFKKMINVI